MGNYKVGDHIPTKIQEGLSQSRVLVLCTSINCDESDWVALEYNTRLFRDPLNRERRFIPLRLDDSPLEGLLANFHHLQWKSNESKEYAALLAGCRGEISYTPVRQRVCMISSEYPPYVKGGLGVHVTHLSSSLAKMTEIDLVLPKENRYKKTPAHVNLKALSKVHATYQDSTSWLHFSYHAASFIEGFSPKPDVIHCHDWVTVLAGARVRKELKIPMVFHVHLPNRSSFCSSVENLGLILADVVTVNSEAMAEQIRDRIPNKKIVIIPNGVDTTIFKPGNNDLRSDLYILFVGRLVEQKGVDNLLRAFVHVREFFPHYKLKIVGTGPCDDAYLRLADCLVIRDYVEFIGWRESAELAELYRNASVVVIPSIYEPFGMTALEAMACGSPVVASNTGGLREIIKHQETGCLVRPGDHLDIAQWIMALLHRDDWRREMGERAAEAIHSTSIYNWDSIAVSL